MKKGERKYGTWCGRASLPPVGSLHEWPTEGAPVAPITRTHERYTSRCCKRRSPRISSRAFCAICVSLSECKASRGVQGVANRDLPVYRSRKEPGRKQSLERVLSQQQVRDFHRFSVVVV